MKSSAGMWSFLYVTLVSFKRYNAFALTDND
jgi:hypothetical protein